MNRPNFDGMPVARILESGVGRRQTCISQFVQLLSVLDIQTDEETPRRAFQHILPLCRSHGLTSYAAAYLDLVLRRQLPLASLDDALRRAVTSFGMQVLGK